MKHALFFSILLALSSVAGSDQSQHGIWKDAQVTSVVAYADGGSSGKGYVVVTFAANGTGSPHCAAGYPRSVAIDLSTAGGGFTAAIVQAAVLTGASMTVLGSGSCSVIPTVETVASVEETSRH